MAASASADEGADAQRLVRPGLKAAHTAGIDFPQDIVDDVRHTAASLAISAGATPNACSGYSALLRLP